ncbi:MAG: hypothetical protein CVT81_00550 [Alphaproteobacteria bacterium HGW-Alphaproteobacteria-3]|nr:MAG: hypothetical protein CVT81_00550 [Alphaproteobacteria bacterium HGW-Alphaproteobacteria-3]
MARLVRAIHVFLKGTCRKDVDDPHKAGHDDMPGDGAVLRLQPLQETEFRIGRAHDQDFTRTGKLVRHFVEELRIFRLTPARTSGELRMLARRLVFRRHLAGLGLVRIEVENARLVVIDPDDGVVVIGHGCLPEISAIITRCGRVALRQNGLRHSVFKS